MPKILTDSELDREVRFVIYQHKGGQNAVRRWDLTLRIFGEDAVLDRSDGNTYDRQLRKSIERLRRQGHLICNLGNGDGYFLASTKDEYQDFRSVYGAHAFPIMETIRALDQAAGQKWPNPLQPGLL